MIRKAFYIIPAVFIAFFTTVTEATPIQSYYSLGSLPSGVDEAAITVKESLSASGFEIIGEYSPSGETKFRSIVYTRSDIITALGKLEPERMLAAALKVGLKEEGSKVVVTMTNPELIFRAYTQKEFAKIKAALMKASRDAISAFPQSKGFSAPAPMGGGDLDSEKVYKYHYMFGMQYFEDMVKLNRKKVAFEKLTAKIEKNLSAGVSNTSLVYTIKPAGEKLAIYGIGLLDRERGEPFFLPIIGDDHLAAMPYELIVINDTAFILHGRYRIALHWPALTMMTFGKIISTPGAIIDQMEDLVNN